MDNNGGTRKANETFVLLLFLGGVTEEVLGVDGGGAVGAAAEV